MQERTEKHNIGIIELGNRVRISDPCYDMDTWCAGTLENVLPGKYVCNYEESDEDRFGWRVSMLRVAHENYVDAECFEHTDFVVGVDSGQAGIYDETYFAEHQGNDTWYQQVCSKTSYNEPHNKRYFAAGIIDGKGAVSSSGYGDGGYDGFVARDDEGHIVAIEIVFLVPDEEDDEY